MSGVIEADKCLLLAGLSDVLDRIASPDLSSFDYSAGRNHRIGCNNASFLKYGTFHNDWVVSDVDILGDFARVQGAIVLDDSVTF